MKYILIADDNEDITDVLSAYVKKEGYELTSYYKYISLLNDPYTIWYKRYSIIMKI